jgi:hypothetical protein
MCRGETLEAVVNVKGSKCQRASRLLGWNLYKVSRINMLQRGERNQEQLRQRRVTGATLGQPAQPNQGVMRSVQSSTQWFQTYLYVESSLKSGIKSQTLSGGREAAKATRNLKITINTKSKSQIHNIVNKYFPGVCCIPDTWTGSGIHGEQNRHGPESQADNYKNKKEL